MATTQGSEATTITCRLGGKVGKAPKAALFNSPSTPRSRLSTSTSLQIHSLGLVLPLYAPFPPSLKLRYTPTRTFSSTFSSRSRLVSTPIAHKVRARADIIPIRLQSCPFVVFSFPFNDSKQDATLYVAVYKKSRFPEAIAPSTTGATRLATTQK